jgi:hypothetical protein
MPPSAIVKSILQRLHQPDLLSLLSEKISGSDLNSVLMELFKNRTAVTSAPELLKLYSKNRFVKPADLPVIEMKKIELDLLELFQSQSFKPIELSPVTILGSCSVVATADQNKILSSLRGTEVLADATNAIALHYSDLKKSNFRSSDGLMRYSTIQRHVRAQSISGKGFTPHFKIACLVTCGADTGNFTFEKESLSEHVRVMRELYLEYYKVDSIGFRILCREGYEDPLRLAQQVKAYINETQKGVFVDIIEKPEKPNNYYKGIQYKIDIQVKGKRYEIGDGGFVDWTQQLLQNKKERMLSTGIGFEFMYRILRGDV